MNFIHNIKGNRWVIIAPARVTRPHDNPPSPSASSRQACPFCPENDGLNKELFRVGDPWKIRVIANKYPLTDYHEVIIHSPDHEKDIDELPLKQVELILQTYRTRYNFNQRFGKVLIFNNHDIHAGASLRHPHSQIVVVPPEISVENIVREPVANVVMQSKQFTAYCPDYCEWPYEIWLAPNQNSKFETPRPGRAGDIRASDLKTFGQITDDQIKDLAIVLQKILQVIVKKFTGPDIPYNFYIYHGENWYLRIIPRFVHRAGFELGTGILVNIVDPAMAAKEYREGII